MKKLLLMTMFLGLAACGKNFQPANSPQVGVPQEDGGVVVGSAMLTISTPGEYQTAACKVFKFLQNLILSTSYASSVPGSGNTTVTFNNAPGVTFTISVSGLAPTFTPTFTGETLNLGSIVISALTDNNLKVCGAGNNQKCTQAVIRMYTTGTTAGFLNTGDTYGVPVYAGTLNPTTQVGLGQANAVIVQQVTIANGTNKQHLTDFPSPTYAITSDFSNAGSGAYSMAMTIEYVLNP